MTTHKAYRLHTYGGPESIQLDEIPVPAAGPSQVLVAVSAVAINPFDWKIREGFVKDEMPLPLPYVLGVDFSGTVAALGEGASRFKVGDRVMTMSNALGAFAEHIVVDEATLARVPDSLSDYEAATLPIPGITAWRSVHEAGELKPGSRVLIHGASGTSGSLAVQFAKAEGAYVIGTASAKNRDYVLSLGADEFIDYQTERFEDRAKDIDLVLDYVLVGGDMSTTDRSWSVLKPDGAIVTVADPSILGRVPEGRRAFFPHIVADADLLQSIGQKRASGQIKTKVARVFSRGELPEALEINRAGGGTGRLIVDFKKA